MSNWLTNFAGWLGGWMVSPWLLLGGALLVAAPILIHLLNKRKFKLVDWAAMDFLLEADKMNRRRIRLEDLLLLLLRCLAVLLLALLVARPFWPTTFAGGLLQSVRFERIVVLDDSLSMQVHDEGRSCFDVAKQAIADLVTALGGEESDESFSLVLLSRADRPRVAGVQLGDETAAQLSREILALPSSDLPVRLADGLLAVEKMLDNQPERVNRVVYIFGDMRARDWSVADAGQQDKSAGATLTRIAEKAAGCYVVDAGTEETSNLVITSVTPREKVLLAGVRCQFDVTVRNAGPRDVADVPVRFNAGESLPLTGQIGRIAAGATATVAFTFTFTRGENPPGDAWQDPTQDWPEAVPVKVSLVSDRLQASDRLSEDNDRFYAARVVNGIRTLIVDGDPSAAYGRAESFSLKRALAPPGSTLSGIAVKVVTDVEFDAARFDDYHVVFLCNLYRLTDQRRIVLENWVANGGGLVILPGDQIDEHIYNETLYRDGDGLLPVRLLGVRGDETEETWVNFRVSTANHPALGIFAGENNPFVDFVKVFRWWGCAVDEEQLSSGDVVVSARFSDPQNEPAVIERRYGSGRVLVIATPADRDWNNWPLDPSYVVAMQELARYMVSKADRDGTIGVGESIRQPLDLTRYRLDVSLRGPSREATPVVPTPQHAGGPQDETRWTVDYADVDRRGFYELQLLRTDGQDERVLFAANVEPSEGDLRRVDMAQLRESLEDAPIEVVTAESLSGLSARGSEGELWPLVLCFVVVVLCGEQLLGWVFGRRR